MSKEKPMVSAGNSPQVRYSATYPTGARAYRESDSFAMWAVHHGVTVSMTTVSISSDPVVPHTESRMRENCTYGSMRGRAFPTGRHALLYTP